MTISLFDETYFFKEFLSLKGLGELQKTYQVVDKQTVTIALEELSTLLRQYFLSNAAFDKK